jgi:hypothetical protein
MIKTTVVEPSQRLRAQIEAQVEKFLKGGGTIKKVARGTSGLPAISSESWGWSGMYSTHIEGK